ncbi:MAG: hypothetical protein IJV19_00310 [Prevotella sp.]|nr:hypothetical protein [Prevotella sp.]
MSIATLEGLRDYLYSTLSPSNMLWLSNQLADFAKQIDGTSHRPYTTEELHERIAKSERDIAEGNVYDFDEVLRDIEEEQHRC